MNLPTLNLPGLLRSLDRFRQLLPEVVRGVATEDARWKPADGAWSILEIVVHLADEEEFDFRVRLELTLTAPETAWPSIDPEGWAVTRKYNEGNLEETVQRFCKLRGDSLAWLRSLVEPNWHSAHSHPTFGSFAAGDILAAWVAHDQLHLRQLAKRFFQLADRDAGGFSNRYAGTW